MEITKNKEGQQLTVALKGRLDTTTAPQLESELSTSLDDVTALVLDFKDLEYISSAGLRVMLSTQKTMNAKGDMTIKNVCDDIMEVFEITGFSDILTIEK
ncbi:MAG: STAS domain-containing protein [Clostridia bacterium]|nr:STAS domain-containing protein [Clostridia bacterium]